MDPSASQTTQSKKNLLVVEDELPMAKALQLKLSQEGFNVDLAHNGEEALQKIHQKQYDLILTDIIMPQMDGFTLLEKLHEEGNKTPTIVTSNLSQNEDEAKAKELGAIGYLIKSNTQLSEIISYIKNILSTQ